MKVGIFLRNLDEILSEFHEHLQKMSKFGQNFGQNPETDEIIQSFK